MTLLLSRLRKAKNPALDAVGALLDPGDDAGRFDADHRLLWSLFAGDPSADRDFLWRSEGGRDYLVLSHRAPQPSPFFEAPQTRDFAPDLRAGDGLAFQLRVNATRTRKKAGRVDIVMDALHAVPSGPKRVEQRMDLAHQAATAWMAGQGARSGFECGDLLVEDYRVITLHSAPRKGRPHFGVLDLSGTLTVRDPAAFLPRLATGFGRAKAFGCGLMLIRRA